MSAASLPLSLLSLAIIVFVFLTRRALSDGHVLRGDTLEGFVLALLTGAWPMAIVTTLTTWMTGGGVCECLVKHWGDWGGFCPFRFDRCDGRQSARTFRQGQSAFGRIKAISTAETENGRPMRAPV